MKDNKPKRDLSGRFISNKKTIKASKTSKTEEPIMVANVKKTLINALNRVTKLEEELKELKILTSSRPKEVKQENNPSNLNEAYIYEVDVNLPGGIKSIIRTSDKQVFKIGDTVNWSNASIMGSSTIAYFNKDLTTITLTSSVAKWIKDLTISKEPELNTFKDCWNKVKPNFYLSSINEIVNNTTLTHRGNELPSKLHLEWIQELIKLQVVATALNSTAPFYGSGICICATKKYESKDSYILTLEALNPSKNYGDIKFMNKELAQKAISILGEESIKKALRVYVS